MHTLGIDLSTDPKKVWTCEIDWSSAPPRVTALEQLSAQVDPLSEPARAARNGSDASSASRLIRSEPSLVAALVQRLVDFAPGAERVVGVDAPLGWPSAFVDAISDWDDGDLHGFRKRPDLRLRATDRFVQSITGITPMSVSTDRMGSTAMLLAEVLSRTATQIDRGRFERVAVVDGIAEVHPAAALRLWTRPGGEPFSASHYRTSAQFGRPRERLLIELIQAGIEVGPEFGEAMLRSGDAIDALLCALVARAAALGETITPSGSVDLQDIVPRPTAGPRGETIEGTTSRLDAARQFQAEAQRTAEAEGWIHLPRRAELATALGLTPGAAQWMPTPEPDPEPFDPYGRWSNGDGGPRTPEPDEYGPVSRFVGEDDFVDETTVAADDEFVLISRRALDAGLHLPRDGR